MQPIFTWHARIASDQVQTEGVAQRYRCSEGGDKMWDYADKTGELYSQFNQQQRKGKGKAIPLQAWTGPEGSRRSRLPDFKTIGT